MLNCPKHTKRLLLLVLNINHQEGFGQYLGSQADFGASKKKVFEEVRNGVDERVNGWAKQFISQVGKEVLIKSVATTLPNYAMSCFKLPV